MAKVMITESYLEDIANAIREKKGGSDTYTPEEMAEAISSIDSGSTPVINSLNVIPSESQQTFNASNVDGYKPVVVDAMPSGSATPASTISGSNASISTTGTQYLTLSKTVSNIPRVTAGYISSGTAGNTSINLTASVNVKTAATITPGTSDQTITSGTYLTGTQTIVGDSDLVGSNILSTANIFGVQGQVVVQNYYTGSSAPSSSLGSNGDLYLQS